MKQQSITRSILFIVVILTSAGCNGTANPLVTTVTPVEESSLSSVATQTSATVAAVLTAVAATNQPQATPENTTVLPTAEAALPPTELPPTDVPPTLTSTVELTQAESCDLRGCIYPGTFLLARPIAAPGRNTIVTSERYGNYQSATNGPLRGVFFLNSTGTPVLAAADGEVVVAGDDSRNIYGLRTNMYGNLVILKHQLTGLSKNVFTLYGQLAEVSVKTGDLVTVGQQIGKVGATGGVRGSTLRFEVRMGKNLYETSVNPELWLTPLNDENGQPTGALAGRIVNGQDEFIRIPNILVERLNDSGRALGRIYLKSYGNRDLMGQDPWEESFAAGDLPAGRYQISFLYYGMQTYVVEIQPGKLTRIEFKAP